MFDSFIERVPIPTLLNFLYDSLILSIAFSLLLTIILAYSSVLYPRLSAKALKLSSSIPEVSRTSLKESYQSSLFKFIAEKIKILT